MALKLIEVQVPRDLATQAETALQEAGAEEIWSGEGGGFGTVVTAVIGAQRSGPALDRLHRSLSDQGGYRVLVSPLDAVLPRPLATPDESLRASEPSAAAVSREEIYAAIADGSRLSSTYLTLVILASVVAAIGLSKNSAAAVIGAMVVAPLLGPNMGLALGLTLGDRNLIRESLWAAAAGFGLAVLASTVFGALMPADTSLPEIATRTRVDIGDMALALAAGCAGTLAYTTGVPSYLTGVMVAVALLPPAVVAGLFFGQGLLVPGAGALLLALTNATAITLAAMLTLGWKGIRPRNWWQAERARRTARAGLAVFVALLIALVAAVIASRRLLE